MSRFDQNKTLTPDALRSWCELAQARIDVLTERCNELQSLVGSLQASNARARMEGELIKEGIEEIAERLDDWTDHNGIGPKEVLLALVNGGKP
jgi:hypothetical protein